MRSIGVEERRARLGRRHHLAREARSKDVVDVARSLVGLHSTDPATVFLAAGARLADPAVGAIEAALYDERSLLRMLAMRRTMWVVPDDLVPVVDAACSRAIAERERRKLVQLIDEIGVAADGDAERWLVRVEQDTLAALAARGPGGALGAELSADVPTLRTSYSYAEGKSYGGTQNLTTRILNGMSLAGQIVRGRPRGSWNSSQYRWSPVGAWLPDGIAALDPVAAQAELVRAWLRTFGPGTAADVKWWTGLTMGEVRKALARLDVDEVDLPRSYGVTGSTGSDGAPASGGVGGSVGPGSAAGSSRATGSVGSSGGERSAGSVGFVLADDNEPVAPPEPWVALLPALDPTAMGWTERDWYLGNHRAALFDRSGNIGPTVWCDGRIVGGWGQRKTEQRKGDGSDGAVVVRLFEDIGSEMTAAVEAEALRLRSWIGDVRVIPRFRTPLERELTN